MSNPSIPKTQTAAIVRQQGGPVEFDHSYPVQEPGQNEILVKVLYTGVCQSGNVGPPYSDLSSQQAYLNLSQTCIQKLEQQRAPMAFP